MSVMPHGAGKARHMRDLSKYFGVDGRTLRQMIENARRDGCIICSSDDGYFIPDTDAEMAAYYRRTMCRVNTTLATLQPIKDILDESEGSEDENQ